MSPLFEVKPVDRVCYAERIEAFVPERVVDIHTHVWLERFRRSESVTRSVTWPARVARDNSIEDLLETYRLLLPGKQVTPLIFSNLGAGDDIEGANVYVSRCASENRVPALLFADVWTLGSSEGSLRLDLRREGV